MFSQEHSLPTDGDKKTLQERFNKWIALYNSSIDTSRPKSLSRLRQNLREWEQTQGKDATEKKARMKEIKDSVAYLVGVFSPLQLPRLCFASMLIQYSSGDEWVAFYSSNSPS